MRRRAKPGRAKVGSSPPAWLSGAGRCSVALMRVAALIEKLPGVSRAALMMATPANRELLGSARLLDAKGAAAGRYRNSWLHSPAPPCPGPSRDPATCLPGLLTRRPGRQVIGGHPVNVRSQQEESP